MSHLMRAVVLALLVAGPAAASPVESTYNAPIDTVWEKTLAVLRILGWDIDKADRSIGFITTESRRLDGENFGVYEKGVRHRLRVNVRKAGEARTTVSVQRAVFKRERILFVDKDEPVVDAGTETQKTLLDAIGKAL